MKNWILVLLVFFLTLSQSALKAQNEAPVGRMYHVYAGVSISALSYSAASIYFKKEPKEVRHHKSLNVSLITVAGAALGKEIYDYYKHSKDNSYTTAVAIDSFGDFTYTCLAGMSFSLIIPF